MQRMQSSVLLLVLLMATLEIIKAVPYGGGRGSQNAGGPSRRHGPQPIRPTPYQNPNGAGPSNRRTSQPTQAPSSEQEGPFFDLNVGTRQFIAMQIHTKITGTRIALSGTTQPIPDITMQQIRKTMEKNKNNALLKEMNLIAKESNNRIQFEELAQCLRERLFLVAGLDLYMPYGGWRASRLNIVLPNKSAGGWVEILKDKYKKIYFSSSMLAVDLLHNDPSFQS